MHRKGGEICESFGFDHPICALFCVSLASTDMVKNHLVGYTTHLLDGMDGLAGTGRVKRLGV